MAVPKTAKEMETVKTSSLYRLSGIVLISAAVLTVVSNSAMTLLFPTTGPTVPPSDVMSPLWSPIWIVGFVGGVLLLFGLVGLYLRQAKLTGLVGLLGFLLTFLGVLFTSIVAGFFFISVLPYLATKGGSAIEDGFSMVALFGLGGGVLLFLGTILLGISIMRAGIFPRFVGIFMLVGGVLSPAAILGLNLVVSLIGSLSTILLALSFAWIGMILTQQHTLQRQKYLLLCRLHFAELASHDKEYHHEGVWAAVGQEPMFSREDGLSSSKQAE